MANSWADLLKSLKLHHFLSVIIGAATIWVVAHLFAEPGSAVKVLWRLVEYTKPSITEGRNHTTIVEIPLDRIKEGDARRITTTDGEVIYGMDMVVDSTVH